MQLEQVFLEVSEFLEGNLFLGNICIVFSGGKFVVKKL